VRNPAKVYLASETSLSGLPDVTHVTVAATGGFPDQQESYRLSCDANGLGSSIHPPSDPVNS